jgi:vacuolar-type H+-ATPase subunit E/Vma4
MNDVESLLEAQTIALLRRLGREQESRTRHIRDEAATQAADIVRRARAEARTRVHQAVVDTRRDDELALARRRAALDTQARRSRQSTMRDLLDRAWQALPAALQSRWVDTSARAEWCAAACAAARRCLRHLDRLQVEVDPHWFDAVEPQVRHQLAGTAQVEINAIAGLGAGLRIRAGDACLDATLPGLLAARERIASELLAEFEHQVATRQAAEQAT